MSSLIGPIGLNETALNVNLLHKVLQVLGYPVKQSEDLDIFIAKKEEKTEYELLMGALIAFLKESGVSLSELSKSVDQLHFIAGELEEDENKIRMVTDAHLLWKNQNEEAKFHELSYGIGRQQIQLNWLELYKKRDNELQNAIAKSVGSNIIKAFTEDQITIFINSIHKYASAFILNHKGKDQTVSLDKLLSLALPENKQREAFVNAVQSFRNEDVQNVGHKKFWTEYLPAIEEFKDNPKLISNLLLTQQLTTISGNHSPLIEELQVNRQLSSITQLLEIGQDTWKEILTKTGIPVFIQADNEEERIRIYTEQIESVLNAAYPTKKIAVMLENGELPIKDQNTANGISTFLKRNEKFEISNSRIHEFKEEIKAAAPQHYENVTKVLKRMQRIFQVSTTPKAMRVLMENNLNSAYSITSIPKKSFIKMHNQKLGGERMAEAVYQRSTYVSTLAAERAMKMHDISHLAAPAMVSSESDHDEVTDVLQRNVPNYSVLFGSPDICECKHCRSVYSAAAYFVDLLRFLWRSGVNADGKSPLDMVVLRRPDLLHLPLTCENTNTIIPYIDLVNEVMEYYTYRGLLDSDAAYDTGETTVDELRANPQNCEPEAYRILKNAVYPFSLPYHQPLDVIRTYSDHLKTERHDVMRGLQKDSSPSTQRAIESEALRISQEEYGVLTGKKFDGSNDTDDFNNPRQLQQYFGFPFADPANPVEVASAAANMEKVSGTEVADGIHEFLRRSGIKYTDLVELIKTKFINPHQHILDFLEKVFANSTMDASTIYVKLQEIDAGILSPSEDAEIMRRKMKKL